MISFLKGKKEYIDPTKLVLDVNGIGYDINKEKIKKINSGTLPLEDLRKWFGKGGAGGAGGGGWDRYSSTGKRLGKCGDAEKGAPYSACLSKAKAAKLGPKGRASFVKRKRAAQKKAGDAKKGGERKKGQKSVNVKTGA